MSVSHRIKQDKNGRCRFPPIRGLRSFAQRRQPIVEDTS